MVADTSGRMTLDVRQVLADVLHRHADLVLAVERDVPGQHLVEHDAERVDVRLAVDVVAERLLGRHVVGRAEHAAVGGQPVVAQRAGDPEVGHLGRALGVQQHVLGLDVAMHDLVRVRGPERAGDLDRVRQRLVDRQPAHPPDPVLERLALDVLEDDVGPVLVLAGVDHADDVGMRELGDRPRLAPEALQLVGVGRHLPVQELDRHPPFEVDVEGLIDRRHPSRADLGVEPIPATEQHAHERAHELLPIVAETQAAGGPLHGSRYVSRPARDPAAVRYESTDAAGPGLPLGVGRRVGLFQAITGVEPAPRSWRCSSLIRRGAPARSGRPRSAPGPRTRPRRPRPAGARPRSPARRLGPA